MYDVDPEVAAGLIAMFGPEPAAPVPVDDWATRRHNTHAMFSELRTKYAPAVDVETQDVTMTVAEGASVGLRIYRPHTRDSDGVLLYLHGGGMIMCNLETHDAICREYAVRTGMCVVAVDYRLAPEHPFPVPVDDCMAALRWVAGQRDQGWAPHRIVVGGESAGGGLAAAVALRARDEGGPEIAGLLLVYPMLDDRTCERDAGLDAVATWTYDDHLTAWRAYVGTDGAASGYAAPLRAETVVGLPPTYLEVGELDIFRAEITAFAGRLLESGVRLEFHLHPAVPHAFELFAPAAAVSERAMADRVRALKSLQNKKRAGLDK